MGFTTKEGMVRLDFFGERGKWHETEEVCMTGFYFGSASSAGKRRETKHYLLPDAVIEAIRADPRFRRPNGTLRYAGEWCVCLDPYHEFAHPQMFRVPER